MKTLGQNNDECYSVEKFWIEWKYHGGRKLFEEEYLKVGNITGSGIHSGIGHNKNN